MLPVAIHAPSQPQSIYFSSFFFCTLNFLVRYKRANNSNPFVDHRLRGNPVLENFKGLENVEYWKGGLFVEGSPKFNSVNHLKSLKISDGIVLTNTSIEVLGPMMSLEKTAGFSLFYDKKLKIVNGLPRFKAIHNGIQFEYNPLFEGVYR